MNLDKVDISVIAKLWEKDEYMTTTELAKEIYDLEENDVGINTLDARARHRLEKLEDYGVVEIDEEGSVKKYGVDEDNVIFGKRGEIAVETEFGQGVYEHDVTPIIFLKADGGFYVNGFFPAE